MTLNKNSILGHEARMHQANAPESSAGLVSCPEHGAGYISNSDRFHSDTSGEEYQLRMANYQRNQQAIQYRRNKVCFYKTIPILVSMCASTH